MVDLEKEILRLRFHQRLLLNIIRNPKAELDMLFVEKNLTEEEVQKVLIVCDIVSKQFEIEKAEGYFNFQPLLMSLKSKLTLKISLEELVNACLKQGMYMSFMEQMAKELRHN